MYATIILIKNENLKYEEFVEIVTKAKEKIKSFKGLISAYYYADREKREYGVTALYETLEDLEASRNSRSPEVGAMLGENITENTYEVFNVITPD